MTSPACAARRAASTPLAPHPAMLHLRRSAVALLLLLLALPLAACGGGEEGGEEGGQAAQEAASASESPAPAPPAAGGAAAATAGSYGELPAHFRGLVRSEMTNLEPAMQRLLSFIARGDARMAAFTARQIEETFVLKRSMTEEQRQQMLAQLPEGFLTLDRRFHGKAGEAAQALDVGDFHTAAGIFSEMTRLCVSCHGRYATNRFPALAGVPEEEAAEEAEATGETDDGDQDAV